MSLTFVDFVTAGKDCGFAGAELREWAAEQLHQYKENKREEDEKAREEAEEAERVHKRELELIEAKLELARLESRKGESSGKNDSKADNHAPRAPLFKFTHFNDKTDDLDSFLTCSRGNVMSLM